MGHATHYKFINEPTYTADLKQNPIYRGLEVAKVDTRPGTSKQTKLHLSKEILTLDKYATETEECSTNIQHDKG